MQLEHIKLTIAGVWVLTALVIAIVVLPSTMGAILLGSLTRGPMTIDAGMLY